MTKLKSNDKFQLVLVLSGVTGLGREIMNDSAQATLKKMGYVWAGGNTPLFPLQATAILLNSKNYGGKLNLMGISSYAGPLAFANPTKVFDVVTQYEDFLIAAKELVTVEYDIDGAVVKMNPFGANVNYDAIVKRVTDAATLEANKLFIVQPA